MVVAAFWSNNFSFAQALQRIEIQVCHIFASHFTMREVFCSAIELDSCLAFIVALVPLIFSLFLLFLSFFPVLRWLFCVCTCCFYVVAFLTHVSYYRCWFFACWWEKKRTPSHRIETNKSWHTCGIYLVDLGSYSIFPEINQIACGWGGGVSEGESAAPAPPLGVQRRHVVVAIFFCAVPVLVWPLMQ